MLAFLHLLQLTMLYCAGAFLFYAPFTDCLRFSKKRTLLFLMIFFAVLLLIHVIILQVAAVAALAWFFITLPMCYGLFVMTVIEKPQKSTVVLLLIVCYGAFVCGCSVFIANLTFDKGLGNSVLYTIAILFIGGATYPNAYRFLLDSVIPPLDLIEDGHLLSIYFMPLFYIVLQIVFYVLYDTLAQMNDLVYFVVLVAINVSIYFIILDILHILSNAAEKLRMQEELSITEKLLDLQKSQYASWVDQIEAVRRARHDLKHHIALVQTFLDNNDKEGLQAHVRDFQRTLPETAPMQLCKHMSLNAILLHYYDRAKRDGVKLSLLVEVEQDININPQDLSVIFGNCLENAFESCSRMEPTAEKTVSVMAKPMGKGLAIVIDNTFDGQTVQQNDVFLSSKRDHNKVGIGIASVKLIVKKYGGIVLFETSGNIFMTSIRLASNEALKEAKAN